MSNQGALEAELRGLDLPEMSASECAALGRFYDRRLADLQRRARREPRRRRSGGLYFHGTGLPRNASIRADGICAADSEPRGPFLDESPAGAFLFGVRDLWRADSDERCIVYAVRAPRATVRRHPRASALLEWWVPSGRVPPSWIVAHTILPVPPQLRAAAGEAHMRGLVAPARPSLRGIAQGICVAAMTEARRAQ
jgi:hypothetical protein